MAAPKYPDMQSLSARLATFEGPRQIAKRRASNAKKKQPASASWSQKNPVSPQELAEAGFYYNPTQNSADSCTCFLCGSSLDGWKAGDNPALEHATHVPHCGWAINVAIGERRQDEDRAEEDPMSDRMVESRMATFGDAWPHESKKGWKPKVKKLVEAGWCFNPEPEYEDAVCCFYCGTSLDGWEPKDDPAKEHRKRAKECHFFTLVEESKKLKKQTKGGKGRASKASRTSTVSTVTVDSEQPSFSSLGDYGAEGDSMLSVASTTSRTTRGRSKTVRGTAARRGKASESVAPAEEAKSSVVDPKRGRKRAGTNTTVTTEPEAETSEVASKKTAAKGRTAAAKKAAAAAAAVAQKEETVIEPEPSMISAKPEARATRGRKRNSNGEEKLESSIIVIHEDKPKPAAKPKSKKAAAKTKATTDADSVAAEEETSAAAKKPTRKAPASKREPLAVQTETTQRATSPERLYTPAEYPEIPSPSAQSSDAENVPPSARPSLAKQMPLSPPPAPTPQQPRTSPSKRNVISGGLQSTMPWHGVPLDEIMLPSPTSAAAMQSWQSQFPGGKATVDQVLASLSSPEKKMTVEEWILANAEKAEEQLRAECEKMITKFENEGNRALGAMAGIECG